MKVTELLKKQHKVVLDLFEQIEDTKKPEKQQAIVEALAREVITHVVLEEQVVYPAVHRIRAKNGLDINEAYEEHMSVKMALTRLIATPPQHEAFHARTKVVRELFQHHLEEEEGAMFKLLNQHLDRRANDRMLEKIHGIMQTEMERDPLRHVFGEPRAAKKKAAARRSTGRGKAARRSRAPSARAP